MAWIAVVLFVVGLSFGSFVNALVWRLHERSAGKKGSTKLKTGNLSIINGRSMCPNCRHTLAWYDLIPLASWLMLRARCRYCKKPISSQYPLVELTAGLVFALSYLFWPEIVGHDGQWLLLGTWLASFIGLLALAVYDLRWTILPSRIVYPTLAVAAIGRIAYIAAYQPHKLHAVGLWVASVAVASGIFWFLYTFSKGKWIGYGDVRLGLITGTLLAGPDKSFLMIFLASIIGTLVATPALVSGRKTMASRLPFGPFLIAATAVVIVFGGPILDWYTGLFGL
ncbi:MAG TPA: prepilin peptidase [Candidatus Saccharimonadales bacterium]|nr:prepilin peptidase [Candidatus Saccharimonadales bacterium]